ncbi:MAG: cysteine hydrolase [Candidatus Coatesbacteria bacterium]|nr:cysteine hydrolase [Candidatus Coatesbacteria bacterium]
MRKTERYITKDNIKEKTEKWLYEIKDYLRQNIKIKYEKAALLVVDMQNFFIDPTSPAYTPASEAIIENVNGLIQSFRKLNRPVIYTCHSHHKTGIDAGIMAFWWAGILYEGTYFARIHNSVYPDDCDKIIHKHRFDAFYNTDLEIVLRCQKIEQVVIVGIKSNLCCESTARSAYFRDLLVFFPADGSVSSTEDMHVGTLRNLAYGFAVIGRCSDLVFETNSS